MLRKATGNSIASLSASSSSSSPSSASCSSSTAHSSNPFDTYATASSCLSNAKQIPRLNGANSQSTSSISILTPTIATSSAAVMPSQSSAQVNLNRMSAPVSTSSAMMTKMMNKTLAADPTSSASQSSSLTDPMAPPLPPRKSSPSVDSLGSGTRSVCKVMPSSTNVPSSSVHLQPHLVVQLGSESGSGNDFEVPRTTAPPIPKHQSHPLDTIINEFKHTNFQENVEINDGMVIVGPAETITGIIDTRPLEARKPIIISNPVHSNGDSDGSGDIKENVLIDRCNSNNLYQFKTSSAATNHARHPSLSLSNAAGIVPKSVTTPQFQNPTTNGVHKPHKVQVPPLPSHQHQQSISSPSSSSASNRHKQPLLYENVAINNKDCNVPYENINLEYIARLVSEGYSKENAITALGISRNNIEMACDILHEFVSKSSV